MKLGSGQLIRYAPGLAFLYLAAVVVVLLYPFEFTSPFASLDNSAAWLDDGKGVRFGGSGMLVSAALPTALFEKLRTGKGLTVEIWLSTSSNGQSGPARIASYSLNPWERNFTLGQDGGDLDFRLRTTNSDPNGRPGIEVAGVFRPGKMQHIVVTYDFSETRFYVDGGLAGSYPRSGGFETWDPSCLLVFGNEASGGRPWDGSIAYAAIYDRPLGAPGVAARFSAGYEVANSTGTQTDGAGPIAAYDFRRDARGRVSDRQAATMPLPSPELESPDRVPSYARLFFLRIGGKTMYRHTSAADLIRNVILFLPFGVLGLALIRKRTRSTAAAVAVTVAAAFLFSAACEALQFFLDFRTSSILDVGTNTAGALIGAVCCAWWIARE